MADLLKGKVLCSSVSMPLEIGNSLSAMIRRKLLTPGQAFSVWNGFREIPIRLMDIPFQDALEIAFQYKIYAYDAYILSGALAARQPLVTLDETMKRIGKELGLSLLEVYS